MEIDTSATGRIRDASMLGRALAEHRRRQGLTQARLAAVLGTHAPMLSHIEQGHATAQLDLVFLILRELGLELQVVEQCRR